jgi:repressor LexA
MVSLTPKQKQVYDFIAGFIREKGHAPSLMEIAAACQLKSLGSVSDYLQILKERGWIQRQARGARSIGLTVVDGQCPTCGQSVGGAS